MTIKGTLTTDFEVLLFEPVFADAGTDWNAPVT